MYNQTKKYSQAPFKNLLAQLQALQFDIIDACNQAPDSCINNFKLVLVNQLLKKANTLISLDTVFKDFIPISDFDEFSAEASPTYSDVKIVINQYINSIKQVQLDCSAYFIP